MTATVTCQVRFGPFQPEKTCWFTKSLMAADSCSTKRNEWNDKTEQGNFLRAARKYFAVRLWSGVGAAVWSDRRATASRYGSQALPPTVLTEHPMIGRELVPVITGVFLTPVCLFAAIVSLFRGDASSSRAVNGLARTRFMNKGVNDPPHSFSATS